MRKKERVYIRVNNNDVKEHVVVMEMSLGYVMFAFGSTLAATLGSHKNCDSISRFQKNVKRLIFHNSTVFRIDWQSLLDVMT